MGAMSQLAMEKDAEITSLHNEYMTAFEALMFYQDKYPPAHRTVKQMQELTRLESICGMAKMRYERAEERRYRV